MSRSNPTTSQNPASIFYEWDGDKGHVKYYDKEKGENVVVKLPFQFLLLDQVSRIGGYSESQQAGFYSNEVKNINEEVLTVKTHGGGVVAQGLYRDIKDSIKSKGAKFVASLYIAVKQGDLVIQNFQMKGAALSGWMDFCKQAKGDIWQKAIIIDGMAEGKKGNVTYQTPTFKLNDVSDETNEKATELDKELQRYLNEKITHSEVEKVSKGDAGGSAYSEPEETDSADEDDDLPF